MYKQLIIARKDLDISPERLAVQVSHASIAFLIKLIRDNTFRVVHPEHGRNMYETSFSIDTGVFDKWIDNKAALEIELWDKNQLLKAKKLAENMGLQENKDFFIIKDRDIISIGFIPLDSKIVDKIRQV